MLCWGITGITIGFIKEAKSSDDGTDDTLSDSDFSCGEWLLIVLGG